MRWYARDQVCRNWRDAGEMENTASHICWKRWYAYYFMMGQNLEVESKVKWVKWEMEELWRRKFWRKFVTVVAECFSVHVLNCSATSMSRALSFLFADVNMLSWLCINNHSVRLISKALQSVCSRSLPQLAVVIFYIWRNYQWRGTHKKYRVQIPSSHILHEAKSKAVVREALHNMIFLV
jgi:hypothetical protein